jgi:hypothetical protein
MLSPQVINCQQVPLIHEVHADDQYLLNTIDGEWFEILHHFHWVDYRHHAATYYDALYAFNIKEQEASISAGEGTSETEKEAKRAYYLIEQQCNRQQRSSRRSSIKVGLWNAPPLMSILCRFLRVWCQCAW